MAKQEEKTKIRYRLAKGLKYIDSDNVNETMKDFTAHFEKELPGSKVIYMTETGSVLHGTNSESSDSDYKGIYIPSLESIIRNDFSPVISIKTNEDKGSNGADDIDVELFSLQEFCKLAGKMESNTIEILFSMNSNKVIVETEESLMIKEKQDIFVSQNIDQFIGFAMSMAYRYSEKGDRLKEVQDLYDFFKNMNLSKTAMKTTPISKFEKEIKEFCKGKEYVSYIVAEKSNKNEGQYIKILNKMYIESVKVGYLLKGLEARLNSFGKRAEKAKESDGIDYKAFAHAIRAIRQARDILLDGKLVYPIPYAEDLKTIKYSKILTKLELSNQVEEEYQDLLDLRESDTSKTQKNPVFYKIEDLKVGIYNYFIEKQIKGEK